MIFQQVAGQTLKINASEGILILKSIQLLIRCWGVWHAFISPCTLAKLNQNKYQWKYCTGHKSPSICALSICCFTRCWVSLLLRSPLPAPSAQQGAESPMCFRHSSLQYCTLGPACSFVHTLYLRQACLCPRAAAVAWPMPARPAPVPATGSGCAAVTAGPAARCIPASKKCSC